MRMIRAFLLSLILIQPAFAMFRKSAKVHPEHYIARLLVDGGSSRTHELCYQVVCPEDERSVGIFRLLLIDSLTVELSCAGPCAEGYCGVLLSCALAKAHEWHCCALRFAPNYMHPHESVALIATLRMYDFKRDEKGRWVKYFS